MGFLMCLCVGFVMCGCVYVWVFLMCGCVGFVMCVCMCGFCNVCVYVCGVL